MKWQKHKTKNVMTSFLIFFFLVTTTGPILQNSLITTASASPTASMLNQYTMYDWQHILTPQQYASYTDAFQIPHDSSSTIINQIHSIDPSFIGRVYRNVIKISKSASSEWTEFEAKNWILKDATGNYPYETRFSYYFPDLGSPGYQQWIANWVYDQTTKKGANGVFFDGGLNTMASELWEFASKPPINPRTGTFWSDQELRDAYVGIYNAVRAKLGSDRLIVVNGIWSGSRWLSRTDAYKNILDRTSINGIMGEGWWREFNPSSAWYSESRWKSSLDALISLENNFIKGSSSKMFIPGCYVEPGDASLPPGATATQAARYGYASTLLGIQSNRNYLFLTSSLARLEDYSNRYVSLGVGTPLGDYSIVPATHVYQRYFSNALVLVNPTGTAYTVPLSGQYTNLNGATVSGAYTVPAYAGEVLMTATQNQYALTASTVGSGSVTKNPNQASYASGTVVTLTATPAAGYSFTGWSGDLTGSANPASTTMNGNKAVTATFAPTTQYQLKVNLTGGKGWTNPLPGTYNYNSGATASITAYNNAGWKFSYWSLDGVNMGSSNPLEFTMTANHVIQAMYIPDQVTYSLTGNVVGSGSVTKNPNQASYASGTVVTLTATPAAGYSFTGWSGDLTGSANPASITINANKVVTATFAQSNWWNIDWRYRSTITIDHTKVAADQTNFPALIDITHTNLKTKAQTDGDDFAFVGSNNVKLDHQIELYNSSTGHLMAWVKIPTLSSTADTAIYLYYGNPTAGNQQNPKAVWDTNYKMVQHLNEQTGTHYDSTVNGKNGVPFGSVAQGVAGKIGGSDDFSGGYVELPRTCTVESQFTFSAWLNPRPGARYILSEWTNNQGAFIQVAGDSVIQLYINGVMVQKTVTLNQWHYVVATYDGTTARLYVDGGAPASVSTSSPTWPTQSMYVGDRSDHQRQFKGQVDEVRISNAARSSAWINTEYSNQNSPATFCSYGSEENSST